VTQPFQESKHRRASGGKFAAGSSSTSGPLPAAAWASGPVRRGTGRPGARDPRVVAAQRKLNALGIGDERGRPLLVDGVDGAHTTAAIKRWQQANGMKPTGELDAAAMAVLLSSKPKPTARARMSRPKRQPGTPRSTPKATPKKPAPRAYADHGRGFSRFGPGAST
jgi:peptidoglycan hydrolase-like protein with peptidoglycan-binding domain